MAAAHERREFADEAAWKRHLEDLGITALQAIPDPVRVAIAGNSSSPADTVAVTMI